MKDLIFDVEVYVINYLGSRKDSLKIEVTAEYPAEQTCLLKSIAK